MNRRKAFTIMELLIAASIFAVISLCLYSAFSGGIRVWRRQEQGFRSGQAVRLALDMMAKELRNSMKYSQPAAQTPTLEEENTLQFIGEAKRVSFMTAAGGNIAKVSYYFDSEPDKKGLLKKVVVLQKEGFKEANQKEETLISGVDDLLFEYAYQGEEEGAVPEWKEAWPAQQKGLIPSGVRITLEFSKGAKQEGREIFRKTVFIPAGQLEKEKA